MIRKFCRNLLLRALFLAFTGDQAVEAIEDEKPARELSAAASALQALDRLGAAGWQGALLPVAAYEMVRGGGY